MLVIYHESCADGFCCAWLLNKAFPNATLMPYNYGTPPPDVKGHDVIMADFSFKRPMMEQIINDALTVMVLDHHKSARDELAGLEGPKTTIIFDMERSGGKITADWLAAHRLLSSHWTSSWLVDYTQDRDLWQWKLEYSREINAAIALRHFSFRTWDTLHYMELPSLVSEGRAVLTYQSQIVDDLTIKAVMREIAGYLVPTLNTTTLISEVGERLCEGYPFSATYFDTKDNRRVWSLRSRERSGIDVSEIAKKFGGGGHPRAAGFLQQLEWISPKEL